MAGPVVTQYLASRDHDKFVALVRRYSHDILSPASNLAIGAEVCGKLLRRRAAEVLTDPSSAEANAQPFDALLQQALEFPKAVRWFVWGDNADNPETTRVFTIRRWTPYDAPVWDKFLAEYIVFASAQLERIEAKLQEIERWMPDAALASTEQSADFKSAVTGLRQTLNVVWERLEPQVAEQRVMTVITGSPTS